MQRISISLLVFAISLIIAYYHALYTGDTVDAYLGYFFSLVILPAFIGSSIGFIGIFVLTKNIGENIKKLWWLPMIGITASLIPSLVFVIGMSLPHH